MVRETRYLIVRNLPENCTEETVIDHFQRYGKIQSVKLQAAKDSDTGNTATVAFNDIKSAAKAHHAKNNIGDVTLRTDYWEGSTGTPVLASAPVAGASAVRSATYASTAASTSARVVSAFPSWSKGTSEEDGSSIQDKGDIALTPAVPGGNASAVTASAVLDKLSSTAYDPQRGRARERIKQKKFGQKFEKSGSFGRHGTSTSSRSLEAARSHSEAVAAAAVATSSSTVAPIPTGTSTPVPSNASGTSGLNPIIVCDSKDLTSRDLKDSSRESASRSRPHSVASPSSRNSCVKRSNSQSRSVSQSRSRSRGSASSSSRSHSSATSRSTSPHRSHTSSSTRPQSMVGTSRLVNSEVKDTKQQRDDGDGERRPLGICVMGLPVRSSDSSLRDGLFHEYKKQGKVTAVQICGDGESRCAIISFRKPEDASKALEASQSKIFFGEKISVVSHEGIEVDDNDRSNDSDSMDEYHLKSTRTLFVGNLEKDTTTQDLLDKFKAFGKIIDVDIKRQGASTAFAFVQYNDIVSVVNALRAMEGEHIGINKIKLGFGKSMPTCTVWLDNLPSDASNRSLKSALSRHGEVNYCYVDRTQKKALVYFTSYEDAQRCVSDIKNRPKILKKKLHVDFASRECQIDFLDRMEKSGLIRANERPDETRGHKFRQQRSFDSFQEDGSPTSYGFNRTSSSFSTRNGRSSSGSTSYRRSRQYGDSNFQDENHLSSRRSRRTEEFSQSTQFYSSKGSNDDYDAVLREYGHSQRERREQDVSPRHSADRRVDSQSRQSSRDHSLDRYEKDRTIEIYNSRDTSPDSDNNSYHSDVRYKSTRDDKYSSRDRYDDSKAEDKEFDRHTRQNHNQSPYAHNRSSSHSHDSDYDHRGGSRSQSPPTPIQEDSLIHRIYYPEDYKRKGELDDDFNHYPVSQKQKDSDDILSIKSKTVSVHSTRLGAEVIKTADKNRKRTHEESGLSDSNNLDAKLLRKSEKSNLSYNEKSKKHHYEASRQILKSQEHNCSPGSSGSRGDSENGSVSEGDLRHLHQEKHHILRKLQELNEEGVGTSEPDSPRSVARVKSVAVKDALKISGRSREERKSDDLFLRNDTHRRQSGKVRGSDSRRESRNYISEELSATREDKNLVDEKEESFGGNSDSDFGSDYKRIKRRRTDPTAASSKNKGSSQRPSSVEVSDDELDKKSDQSFRIHSSSVVKRLSCDSRSSSKFYRDSNKEVEVSSCDNGDLFKDGLSDKDISVIKQPLTVPKSESYFPSKSWNVDYSGHEQSPVICFSPYSEEHTQDSVTSGSLTEKSYKQLSPHPWQHSPPASITGKDNLDGDYAYYKDNIPDSTSPDDCLSDDSIGVDLQPAPGEPSVEERIRAIDEILNMSVNKPADPSLLITALANRDVTNNNDNMTLYSKFRIRKREGILDGGNGSLLIEKKPEPSVIMQQVLSKKSILDQDQRRLEHMNEKYDVGGRKDFSAVLNSEISFSKLSDLKMEAYPKSLLSPSAFPLAWSHPVAMTTTTVTTTSSSSLLSSLPMTTSSSVLHLTVTTSSSCLGFINTGMVTTVVSVPIVTSSIYSSPKPAFVDTCKRSVVRPPEYSEDTLDKFPVCAHSLTLKENTITQSSSSHPSSSIPVLTFSNNSISSSLSSPSSLSSTVNGCTIVTETTTMTTASQQNCKLTVSSPLPSLLSPQSVSSTSNLSSSVHSKISLQQNMLPSSSSYTSSVSSSVGQSPGGTPAAAPFTQGPDKSQLTPTVGQEAPRLCSPSFTPENSRTSVSAHLPESRSPRVPITPDDSQKTSCKTDLNVSVLMETGSRISSEELKSNNLLIKSEAVSPDIESPVSVKSETSSIASVPLSSVDIKSKEEKIILAPLTVMISSSCSKYGLGCSSKSPDQGKPGLLSVDFHTEGSHSAENGDKGQEGVSECLRKGEEINEAAESLVSIKMELSPHVNNQVVLSVVNRDSSDKDLSDLPDTSSGGKGKLGPSSSSLNSDTSLKLSSSSGTAPPSSSTTPSRPLLDKSEKRVSGKTSGNYKTSSSPAKSEALFAPDVKVEQPIKSSESKSDARHQNKDSAKGVSNKSSSSDKKSTKPPSKDGVDNKDVVSNKEPEKSEKKSEAGSKNSLGQQESNRSKETSKTKDKRDQNKDGEKAKQKEDSKKKEEKKVAEKKKEKKNQTVKDEKKVERRVEDKKEKIVEKSKEAAKPTPVKQKQEPEGNKVDKKQKEKPKDTGSKDKDKVNDKKTHSTLSSISKQGPPEAKQEAKPISRSESKDSKSTKSEKDSTAKQEKDENQKAEASLKSEIKMAKHRSDSKEAGKAASTTKSDNKESPASAKKSGDVSKSKREQEKVSEKLVKQKQRQEEKLRLQEEKERQKEEKEREEQELKEKEEREKQKEKEEKERKEKEEKEKREKERQKEEEERERQKEKERKEKERREREKEQQREREEQEKQKEKEERERQKERDKEEKERKEKEREEKERQKEKEREERERQKEKEEKERKEKEEKERLRKEKEEREKQKQKEQAEKESQKEKERLDRMKEKQKEKERKEKQKKDKKEMERKEKEKKAKEEKLKKEKEERVRKEKDEKTKKEKEEKEKTAKEKEKADREKEKDEKKKPAPKKPKRNELAALLEHNDMIQMSFTSMYDRVKTQRNREPEPRHKSEPAPKSSFDKFKQNRKKNGSKVKSSLYSFDTSSGGSNDDLSSLSESEPTQKTESVKEAKPKVTKQIKKRPHVSSSSSSSSSCEEDDDALLRASKPKGKKNEIFSSDSDDSFQPPSNKQKASAKTKSKPTPKKRKTRNDSSDSIASRDDFLKSQTISSVTDSLDEIDMSDDDVKVKSKTKVKSSKPSTHSKDSESTVKKQQSAESESSTEFLSKKPGKLDKEESPDKKGKAEPKKSSKTLETKSSDKKKAKHDPDKNENLADLSGKLDGEKPKSKPDSKNKQKSKNELDGKPESEIARSKAESETKPKSKTESETKHEIEKSKSKLDNESKIETEKSKPKMEVESKSGEKSKPKAENQTKHGADKPKAKMEVESKAEDDHSKSKMENESKVDVEKHKLKSESESRSDAGKAKPKDKSESRNDIEKFKTKHEPEVKIETDKHKVESDNNKNSDKHKNKLEIDERLKIKESSDGKNKSQEKKKKSEDESPVKKKKKKMRYDPEIEEQLVNTLITKVYDKDKKEKKKSKVNVLDSEAEDTALVEALTSPEEKDLTKDSEVVMKASEEKLDITKPDKQSEVKSTLEAAAKLSKKEHKKKKEKREHTKEGEKPQESLKTEHPEKEKLESESQGKTEETSEDEHLKPPKKKKKKKKEHERENDKDKISKQEKNHEKKLDGEKSHVSNEEKDKSDVSGDGKSSSQVVDEFISFWGHPKPILIPKRLKDSKKTDDDKTKHKDESKAEGSSSKAEASSKAKEDSIGIKEEKLTHSDDKLPDVPSDVDKTPEPAMTPKVESEASDDCVVPISEAETTIVTEITQPASSEYIESSADSLVIQDESASEETAVLPDETTIGSSVEIDDDDFPLLVIDEIPESAEKKVTKKDKKLLKKEQLEKERNDHMDEVIARVAMAMPSDDEDTTSNDQELILSDVINQELKYESKMSSENSARSNIVSDIFFTEKDKKQSSVSVAQKDKDNKIMKKETEKKKDSNKNFGQLDEEAEKKDEELLKTLAVLCDPNLDKPVVIEDIKKEPTEEEIKKKEEEEKKKAEDERKKAEEEEKTRREKEEQEMREASDEAARAVESLLEFQSGYNQESLDMDDDLPPLIIEPAEKEPAEKEPQIETVCISPSKDKLDIISIFSSPIPEKVTANLDDKLLDEKLNEKGASDQSDSKQDPFNLFATPTSTGTPAPVFTSPRRNSSGLVKDKTPEPVMLPSPQKLLPPSSPQMQSPHRIHFPQRSLPSPQHHLQSPQKPVLPSQIDLQSPQPMLQSPQRSPFFTKDTKIERNFVPTNVDVTPPHPDMEILHTQLPQRNIPNLPVQTHHDQPLRPMQVSPRRKSQEFPPEQVLFSSRRNTIAAPEEATVAHLDRRFQPPIGSNIIFSKERTHAPSSLPPPVSISLDHAPHDRGSQSPMPSLIIPTHQENLLAPRKVSPAIQFKEIIHEQPIFQSPPGKGSLQDQLHHFHKDPIIQKQIFPPKGPTQEQLFYGAKGPPPDFFKTSKIEQPLLLPSKSPISEKPIPQQQVKTLEPGLTPQKSPAQELLLPHSKGPQHPHLDPFSQHGKGVPPREPMFSPKVQPDNPFSYSDQNIDFLLSSPPRGNMGFMSYPPATEVNMSGVSKPQDYAQDPMLIPVTEACAKPPEREVPHTKRVEGFPPSFYQEPISGPKAHQEPVGAQQLQQQNFDDDKKGTKKRKRNNRKASNEDKAAQLAKQQAIEETVQANLDSIKKSITANQAKAAAEKACMVGGDKKKTLDAYDFEAHIGQDVGVSSGPPPVDAMYPGFGETDSKALRSRNDRGRGRGSAATRRGRRGKGGVSSVLEPADTPQRPDPLQHTQPSHFLTHMQGQDHLQSHLQQQNHPPHQQFPPLQQHQQQPHHQQLPPPPQSPQFQRQAPQLIQLGHQMPHYYPHPAPLSLENNSSVSAPDWQQKQITQAYPHGQVPQQSAKMPPLKNDVLSPESNKQDLDLSYGESELIINLDDQPSSIEGKENQYNLSSDGEDRGLIPSPSTPKSQRSTRARKQPDYKAIASGNVQPPVQPRTSRSGGSPRGRGNGAQSPKSNMSPRTRSTENVSSSPVVKLEKLEVGRTTRSRREVAGGKVFAKDDMKEMIGAGTSFEEWKAKISTDEGKSISKENIYEFEDNEQDQQIETSLRSARTRKKRASENQDQLQIQQLPDYMPGSPTSSSNSSILFQDLRHGSDSAAMAAAANVTEMKPPEEIAKLVPLSNVDAIIDAVSKGNFGLSEEDLTPKVAVPAVSEPESSSAPQQTRATRRSTETKKEPDTKADTKTFTIAEQPRFEGREVGRKGPTVPPLRIKVAHGTKVEKNEEKHYVIERTKSGGSAAEHEKPPLAFTVKLSDSGTATIKPAGGGTNVTPISSQAPPVPGLKSQGGPSGEMFKNDNSQKKENSLGLFSGLPQNEPKNAELDLNKQAVIPPAVAHTPSWKQLDPVNSDEAAVPRLTGGAMHPKVAAKVQASQESQNSTAAAQQASLPQYPPSSTPNTPLVLPPKPMTPATPLGLKHAWNSGHPQDSSHQSPLTSDQPPANSYHATHLQSISQLTSREAQMLHQPSNAHQDAKQQSGSYNQPSLRPDRPPPAKTNKPGMDISPDMISKLPTESPKQHQGSFGFSPHIPPAHSGQRPFILPPDQPGHHAAHFPNPAALLKSGPDSRPVKSPSIQPQPPSKMGPEVRTQTPPVAPAMLYTGVVSGQPHSLSPTSASPEGQVIERIQNPIRQSESSQSSSPLTLHLPSSHHPDPGSRFLKDDVGQDGLPPLSGHGDRASSQEMAMYQHILEQQRLQQHLLMAEAARSAAQEAARNSAPDSVRNITAMRTLESSRNTPVALDGGRKGPLTPSQPASHGQPLNLTPQSDNRGGGQTDSSRVTPKSTPPAPQSPFTMQYFDRKGDSSRLQVSVAGTFMQPSPSNHREGIPSHLYSDLGLANLTAHNPYLVGRIPIDPRIYGTGQQSSPHLMRDGVLSGSFPQAFPPGSRFPGLEHPDGKKGDTGHPDQAAPHMLRSPSPIHRQLQADVLRQQLTRMPCDLPTRDSPVGFLQRYPVMWQGALALKNDNSYVQMHFIAGNRRLPSQALPQPMQNGALPPLRISQRMRLEHAQLEGVAKRMQCEDHYCILIAVACGRDQVDISHQTRALSEGFINYLLSKQAAGIVNVPLPGSEQVRFVVHIFPPCEFVDNSVAQQGSVALMEQLREIPHAVIIIATT